MFSGRSLKILANSASAWMHRQQFSSKGLYYLTLQKMFDSIPQIGITVPVDFRYLEGFFHNFQPSYMLIWVLLFGLYRISYNDVKNRNLPPNSSRYTKTKVGIIGTPLTKN